MAMVPLSSTAASPADWGCVLPSAQSLALPTAFTQPLSPTAAGPPRPGDFPTGMRSTITART